MRRPQRLQKHTRNDFCILRHNTSRGGSLVTLHESFTYHKKRELRQTQIRRVWKRNSTTAKFWWKELYRWGIGRLQSYETRICDGEFYYEVTRLHEGWTERCTPNCVRMIRYWNTKFHPARFAHHGMSYRVLTDNLLADTLVHYFVYLCLLLRNCIPPPFQKT